MKTTTPSMQLCKSVSISIILFLSIALPQAPARPASAQADQAALPSSVAQDLNMGPGGERIGGAVGHGVGAGNNPAGKSAQS